MDTPITKYNWSAFAACKGMDVDEFFPGKGKHVVPVQAMCFDCPVQKWCLVDGLDQKVGIFGGTGRGTREKLFKNFGFKPHFTNNHRNGPDSMMPTPQEIRVRSAGFEVLDGSSTVAQAAKKYDLNVAALETLINGDHSTHQIRAFRHKAKNKEEYEAHKREIQDGKVRRARERRKANRGKVGGACKKNMEKTHCPSGHAYTINNCVPYDLPNRKCKTCTRKRQTGYQRNRRARQRAL